VTLSIEVDGLSLRYGDTTALDAVTLRLAGGKIYGLLGRNGSGQDQPAVGARRVPQGDRRSSRS